MLSGWNAVCQIIACSKFLWASYKPLKNGAYNRNTRRAITAAALTYAACSCLVKSCFISSSSSTSVQLPRVTVKPAAVSGSASTFTADTALDTETQCVLHRAGHPALHAVARPLGTSPLDLWRLPCEPKSCYWPPNFCLGRRNVLPFHGSGTGHRAHSGLAFS